MIIDPCLCPSCRAQQFCRLYHDHRHLHVDTPYPIHLFAPLTPPSEHYLLEGPQASRDGGYIERKVRQYIHNLHAHPQSPFSHLENQSPPTRNLPRCDLSFSKSRALTTTRLRGSITPAAPEISCLFCALAYAFHIQQHTKHIF
jgi:hypothetical protein